MHGAKWRKSVGRGLELENESNPSWLSAESTEVGARESNRERIRIVSHNQIKNYVRALLVASVAAKLLYHLVGAEIELVEVLALLLAHAPAGVAPDALQSRMQIADETDNFSLHKKNTPS